jgi:predicted DNA-binding transcriptional regulator AlpA
MLIFDNGLIMKKDELPVKPDEELLKLEEVTAWLKIRDIWVYQRICSKTLPFPYTKIGHFLRFPVSGIKRYIESQTRISA